MCAWPHSVEVLFEGELTPAAEVQARLSFRNCSVILSPSVGMLVHLFPLRPRKFWNVDQSLNLMAKEPSYNTNPSCVLGVTLTLEHMHA